MDIEDEMGSLNQTPLTLKMGEKMSNTGNKMITCLNKDNIIEIRAFPIDKKKWEVTN